MHPRFSMMAVVVVAPLLSLSMPAFAQVYQCKDASGKISYTDAPCTQQQTGRVVEREKTADEIQSERRQADEALERKQRAKDSDRAQQRLDIQQERARQPSNAGNSHSGALASSHQCRAAQKELEFVTSIRSLNDDDRRVRVNVGITNVNAACGTRTPLMQEPERVIVNQPTSRLR